MSTLQSLLNSIMIIIKTSCTCPSGKNKAVYKLLSQPHMHLGQQGSNQRLTASPEPIQRFGIKHSVWKVILHSNLGRQETPCKLGRSRPLVEADGSSLNRQWLEFQLTLNNILSPATLHRWHNDKNSDQSKAWPPNTPGALVAEGDIPQLTRTPDYNTQGLGEQMKNSNEVTQWCYFSPTSNFHYFSPNFHQHQNTNSLRDTANNTTHIWSSNASLLSNFTPRMSMLGLARI